MKLNQQRGVALVITLIMLSVITFLAVAFLALTRREKASVNVSLTQTDARFMADQALARAEAELVSRMIATTNMLNYDLLMTRNYVNPLGFDSNDGDELTNVSYVDINGNALNEDENLENIYNLFYDPRPPVYIETNENELDFRFYLDFNRNGRFDLNGPQLELDDDGQPVNTTNFVFYWGDPEWIGVLEKPQYRHSPTNRFIGRYAFMVLPEGKTLDINFMHNYARLDSLGTMNTDRYIRNQGVGSWELNLAAFLQDLNPNLYEAPAAPYNYQVNPGFQNFGTPFEDALGILTYRYRRSDGVLDLPPATASLGTPSVTAFANDLIDSYANGPYLTTVSNLLTDNDDAENPWPGSRNSQAYRDIQELFDATKTSPGFVQRLSTVAARSNTFDNQTFSRLLSQLGTTSDTNNSYRIDGKDYPKIHLNYDNRNPNTDGYISQTNFFEWEALDFFTNAAEALIQKSLIRTNATNFYIGGHLVGTKFSLTNMMVYPTNQYTPTVHRLLQLAANIHSARTNGLPGIPNSTNLPVVFRPQFEVRGTNVFVTNYVEVTTDGLDQFEKGFRDPANPADLAFIAADPNANVVGVPWVVSAMKGLPNFNEFSFETAFQLTRKMELRKQIPRGLPVSQWSEIAPNQTNLMYMVGITNFLGAEFWNSYTSAFTADITIRFTNQFRATLTNQFGVHLTNQMANRITQFGFERTPSAIPGALYRGEFNTNSFLVEHRSLYLLPESTYFPEASYQFFRSSTNSDFISNSGFLRDPDWDLLMTNQVAAIVIDDDSERVIDFVNLGNIVSHIDLSQELRGGADVNPSADSNSGHALWQTNRLRNATEGMMYQIEISLGQQGYSGIWKDHSPSTRGNIEKQIDEFRYFVGLSPIYGSTNLMPTNRIQVPFTPTRLIYMKRSLQANDPLVHYMAGDLVEPEKTSRTQIIVPGNRTYADYSKEYLNLWRINDRYSPWGGKREPGKTEGEGDFQFDLSVKDPLVRWSDDWDFPTNRFPNVGWLGRVHRGTPWQTVYLKAPIAERKDWVKWAGSADTHPTRDWELLDIFTAAPNDNAARGHLSVNQTGTASWSAVLSGVLVLSNSLDTVGGLTVPQYEAIPIEPSSDQLNRIVNGINNARTNYAHNVYPTMGQVLRTPELSTASPFLNLETENQKRYGINDAAYERIPQQILSLLKTGEPRFAIYSYGQALRPAPNSIELSPPAGMRYLQNLCTNYQITGEVVTKTVLRIEGTPDKPKAVVESFEILSGE